MKPFQTGKTVYYEINGKRYDRIEDVPLEFREMVAALKSNPEALKNTAVTKVTTFASGDLPAGFAGRPDGSHREKFLREAVLPNLHLMDPKTRAEVLRELGGDSEKQPSSKTTMFWIVVYAALGLLLVFGYSAIKNMFLVP